MIFNHFKVLAISTRQEPTNRCVASIRSQAIDDLTWSAVKPSQQGIHRALDQLQTGPEDIVVMLQGCDWLFNHRVLSHIHEVYLKANLLLTCGQYLNHESGFLGDNYAPTPKQIVQRSYRKDDWKWRGLTSFRAKLFHAIKPEEIDPTALEASLLYPMLEMAGPRVHFFPNVQLVCDRTEDHPWKPLTQPHRKYPLL